jgi:hypothetical protein
LGGSVGVEGFGGVNDGAIFTAAGGGGEELMEKTGTAGGFGTADFSDAATGAAADYTVESGESGWQGVELMSDAPPTDERSDVVRESGHIRFFFAL